MDETSQPIQQKKTKQWTKTKGYKTRVEEATPKIVYEIAAGLDKETIAARHSVSRQTVYNIYNKFKNLFKDLTNLDQIEDFEKIRDKLLTASEFNLLRSANDGDCIEKASLIQRVSSLEKIYKMRRLEQGLSTDNQSIKQSTIKITQKS